MSCGILMMGGSLLGIGFTFMTTTLLTSYGERDSRGALLALGVLLGFLLIATILSLVGKNDLRRLRFDSRGSKAVSPKSRRDTGAFGGLINLSNDDDF